LIIAAWVAIWEAIATLLVHWGGHNRNIRVYRRLASAEIAFHATLRKVVVPPETAST
jgi:hypothetical protein